MQKLLMAFVICFATTLLLGFVVLPLLKKAKAKQEILKYVEQHKSKAGTPTMGGIFFIGSIAIACLLVFDKNSTLATLALAITVGYGIVGFLDDFIKIYFKRNLGLRAYQKIILQLGVSLIIGFFAKNNILVNGEFYIPFLKTTVDFGFWTVPFVVFVFLATTNGTNLTDGIDGLASSIACVYMAVFAIILFAESHYLDQSGFILLSSEYKNLSYFCISVFAGTLAYLLFNVFPARVFMGDTGSLALGGAVASVAVLSKKTLFIPIIGFMFVVSVVSVILQVARYKLTKKRFFLMAPYHHHLQMKGVSEPRIVCIYTTITVVLGVLSVCAG